MELSSPDPGRARPGGTGPWTRLRFRAQFVVMLALAAAIAWMATWLAERPGLHRRFDLTVGRTGSLDPATLEYLRAVPGDVHLDVFFRPLEQPWTQVSWEAQRRMRELLVIARNEAPTKLTVADHDLNDIAGVREIMRDLGVADANVVVVQSGQRRAVLRLFPDIAEVDAGNPDPRRFVPARITRFRGEEALAEALKKVSILDPPRVLFTVGHGERDLLGSGSRDLGRLHTLLVGDGFEVGAWDPQREPRIPADCAVLAIVDPRQPFAREEAEEVLSWMRRGGRLFAAPGVETFVGAHGLDELLRDLGLLFRPDLVCRMLVDPFTGDQVDGLPRCADHLIGADGMWPEHPITRPIVVAQRRVRLPLTASLARGGEPGGGATTIELLKSSELSWRDLPDASGAVDYVHDPAREEGGPFPLAMVVEFDALGTADTLRDPDASNAAPADKRRARVFALACPDAAGKELIDVNGDFLLNAFNWLASREFRVTVSPRDPEVAAIDLAGADLMIVSRVGMLGLPALCALLGLALHLARRR